MNSTRLAIGRTLMIMGLVLQFGPFWGLIGAVLGIERAFKTAGDGGIADPTALSASIGRVMMTAASGLILGLIGLALIILALFLGYRSRWSFYVLIVGLFPCLVFLPIGTIVSAGLIAFIILRRKEFLQPSFHSTDLS